MFLLNDGLALRTADTPGKTRGIMSNLSKTDELFFKRTGLDREKTEKLVANALKGADDGEISLAS